MMDEKTAYIIATGRVLRDHRESRGLSVADLAEKSGVPQSRVEQIEAGSISAVAVDLARLAIGLNTPVERFSERIDAAVKELLRKKQTATGLPDLDPILDAYLDAYAIVHTACYAIHNGDHDDKAVATATLRQGVEAFDAANARLEGAEIQLGRFRREGSKS